MTMCFFLGHDVVDSHLMHNKKWAFNSKNYEGLNTYLNDLTLQTNLFLGENFKIQSIEVGLNLSSGLVTSCCSQKTACWN